MLIEFYETQWNPSSICVTCNINWSIFDGSWMGNVKHCCRIKMILLYLGVITTASDEIILNGCSTMKRKVLLKVHLFYPKHAHCLHTEEDASWSEHCTSTKGKHRLCWFFRFSFSSVSAVSVKRTNDNWCWRATHRAMNSKLATTVWCAQLIFWWLSWRE